MILLLLLLALPLLLLPLLLYITLSEMTGGTPEALIWLPSAACVGRHATRMFVAVLLPGAGFCVSKLVFNSRAAGHCLRG